MKALMRIIDIGPAVSEALAAAGPDAAAFLQRLAQHGLTVLPLAVKHDADLFGIGIITRTVDGYAVLDPSEATVTTPIREEHQRP